MQAWQTLWISVAEQPDPGIPVTKQFKPKYPSIPRRTSYEGAFEDSWWRTFPSNLTCPGKSLISANAIHKLSHTLGCHDLERLQRVSDRLQNGADIGCRGQFRSATVSTNAPSAYQYGPEVTDAIAAWVEKGFAYGPVTRRQVPPGAKINRIMVRPKPNGSALNTQPVRTKNQKATV
jgi:hypothetical protein